MAEVLAAVGAEQREIRWLHAAVVARGVDGHNPQFAVSRLRLCYMDIHAPSFPLAERVSADSAAFGLFFAPLGRPSRPR